MRIRLSNVFLPFCGLLLLGAVFMLGRSYFVADTFSWTAVAGRSDPLQQRDVTYVSSVAGSIAVGRISDLGRFSGRKGFFWSRIDALDPHLNGGLPGTTIGFAFHRQLAAGPTTQSVRASVEAGGTVALKETVGVVPWWVPALLLAVGPIQRIQTGLWRRGTRGKQRDAERRR